MLFLLISCFSFILLSNSFLKPFQPWKRTEKSFWRELSKSLVLSLKRNRIAITFLPYSIAKSSGNKAICSRVENAEKKVEPSLLDLPDLPLECILERLSPEGLCAMAGVCTSLRGRCTSDHLWKKHMKQKWGRVIGEAAYRNWQCHNGSQRRPTGSDGCNRHERIFICLSKICGSHSWYRSDVNKCSELKGSLPADAIMGLYSSLDSGKFSFPAQVYNREVQNGSIGFMLSCYDAELNYDLSSDTFRARYAGQGWRTVEENIEWNRLRAPAVSTPAYALHMSDCLIDLKPGDHIEIQWRRSKEFPYGWWYGVVGHLKICEESRFGCQCHSSDMVTLEFKQYNPESQWRQVLIDRKDHREVGSEADGFYGGIRKLYSKEEISVWRSLWPSQILD